MLNFIYLNDLFFTNSYIYIYTLNLFSKYGTYFFLNVFFLCGIFLREQISIIQLTMETADS